MLNWVQTEKIPSTLNVHQWNAQFWSMVEQVSNEKSSWNSTENSRQMWEKWSKVMDHWLSVSEQLSPAFILWINIPFESASEVKSLSGHEGNEREEGFHQSAVCHQAPWAVNLFIVSYLVLMNLFDSCRFRNIYQIQEEKKKKNERVGKNFRWEHMGQENCKNCWSVDCLENTKSMFLDDWNLDSDLLTHSGW